MHAQNVSTTFSLKTSVIKDCKCHVLENTQNKEKKIDILKKFIYQKYYFKML